MPYNGKILARANARLAQVREDNKAEHERRLSQVYARVPEVESLDTSLRLQMVELAKLAFSRSADAPAQIEALKDKNLDAQMRRAELLVANGFPRSYLDDIFSCPLCRDTGYDGAAVCRCLEKLYNQELSKELSSLLRTGNECFDSFDLTLYPGQYSEYFNCVPREYMAKVFSYCKDYAENFPQVDTDLLFQSEPGLGKTFLSACIARTVAEKGYSVCYDTAVSAFSAFEKQQFSRSPEEAELSAEKVSRMLSCDLLILDDLGTEVVTPVVLSALYTLINTRLGASRRTIINTNLYPDDLAARYTSSICSRLDGYFKTVRFAGEDIRQLLKGRR